MLAFLLYAQRKRGAPPAGVFLLGAGVGVLKRRLLYMLKCAPALLSFVRVLYRSNDEAACLVTPAGMDIPYTSFFRLIILGHD